MEMGENVGYQHVLFFFSPQCFQKLFLSIINILHCAVKDYIVFMALLYITES